MSGLPERVPAGPAGDDRLTSLHLSIATESDSAPEAHGRAEQLRRVRRLDWRFLLSDPRLRNVAFLGREDRGLVDALRGHSENLVVLDGATLRDRSSLRSEAATAVQPSFDGIVMRGGALAAAEPASGLLRPGGWLYWELDRRRMPLATPAGVAERLRRAGLDSVALHGHRPGFGDAVDIVPLASRQRVGALLQRDSARFGRRVLARAARGLHAARLLERALPCWSVVARAPGGTTASASAPADLLAALGARTGDTAISSLGDPGELEYSFRLPRFTASSHVLAFVHEPGAASPALVVKVPRLAGDGAPLGREAMALEAVQGIRAQGFDSIPRLVAYVDWRGSSWLVQTALPGRTMTAAWVRENEPNGVAAVMSWLFELHRASRGPALGHRGVARLLDPPLAARHADDITSLTARTLALAAPLASLPAVFEHGDLAAPNLLVSRSGGRGAIGVVDWELADPQGLPGADLVFFLAFVAGARARARTPQEHAAAYRRAVLAASSDCTQLEAYSQALGLPRDAFPAILAATWARATFRALDRTGGVMDAAARPLTLWRETLAHLEDMKA